MFIPGQKVKVIADLEATPEQGGGQWIGKTGTFVAYREMFAIVEFSADQIPKDARDGNNEAWFTNGELALAE